jgi:hypothetical protein
MSTSSTGVKTGNSLCWKSAVEVWGNNHENH